MLAKDGGTIKEHHSFMRLPSVFLEWLGKLSTLKGRIVKDGVRNTVKDRRFSTRRAGGSSPGVQEVRHPGLHQATQRSLCPMVYRRHGRYGVLCANRLLTGIYTQE
jgi:hypothetical protein